MSTIMEERIGGWETGEPVIELYVAYDYLPVEQYARVLEHVNATYQQIWLLLISRRGGTADPEAMRGWLLAMEEDAQQLCIEVSKTGNSISVKFGPKGKLFPGLKFTDAGDLEIITPRWAAAGVLAAAAIGGGLPVYGEIQDAVVKQANIEVVQHQEQQEHYKSEQERLRAELLARQLKEIDTQSILLNPLVQNWAQGCRQSLNTPNIREASINGISMMDVPTSKPRSRGSSGKPGSGSFTL